MKDYKARVSCMRLEDLKKERRYLLDTLVFNNNMLQAFPCKHWQNEILRNKEKLKIVDELINEKEEK